MPAKLSTHVLDLTTGRPAAGMQVNLWRLTPQRSLVKTILTNPDGRTGAPLLDAAEIAEGTWELVFYVREYFTAAGVDCPFLDTVPLRFEITDASASWHVPLLVSPWAYSTYRGS